MHRFFIPLVSLLLLAGCQSEVPVIPERKDRSTGSAFAFKNSVGWEAKVRVWDYDSLDKTFRLTVYKETSPGRNQQTLEFNVVHASVGRQPLLTGTPNSYFNDMANYHIFDVDVIHDLYKMDSTVDNHFVEITRYDPVALEIEGTFHVALTLEWEEPIPNYRPEKLRFALGEFTTRVESGWFD